MNEMPHEPPAIPEKQGISPLGWVGIGCGTLVLVAVLGISLLIGWCKRTVGDLADFRANPEKLAAELMVRMNPDLEKLAANDRTGEMTIRMKDGKVATMSYRELASGVAGAGVPVGSARSDLSDVPAWVPRVPGLKAVTSAMRDEKSGTVSGTISVTSTESASTLESYFKEEAGKLGFTSSRSMSLSADGKESRSQSYSGRGRKLDVVITVVPGEDTRVNVGYDESR